MTLARLALIDLARKKAVAGVQLVGLVTAMALAVALPLMQAVAAEQGLHTAIQSLGQGANLEIEIDRVAGPGDFDAFQADASRRVKTDLGAVEVPGARFVRSNQLLPVSINGQGLVHDPSDPLPVMSYYENLQSHVNITSGSWPQDAVIGGAWQAAVSDTAAGLLGLKVGDLYCLAPNGSSRRPPGLMFCMTITAIWQAKSTADPYWAGQFLGTDLSIGRNSLFQIASGNPFVTLHMAQLYVTDLSQVHAADAASLRDRLLSLQGDYAVISDATFITGLADEMKVFLNRLAVQQALAVSVEFALLAVALYAIGLAALHFLDGQKSLIGLWRARGGSRLRGWLLLMIEMGVLALLAVPLGALIGVFVVSLVSSRLFGASQVLERGTLVSATPTLALVLLAVFATLGVLAAGATRRSVADVRRASSQPALTAWWRRPWVDAAFAVVGILLIVQFQTQAGRLTAASGPDPLTLILPGIALALLAVAGLRLLPVAATLLARGGDLGSRLAKWRLERQPLQHARVALLLSFALALSLFTSAYLSTDRSNALDRARYEAGSDVRFTYGFGTAPSTIDQAAAAVPGVVARADTFRDIGRPGRADLTAVVLGLDEYDVPAVASWRSDFARQSLPDLMSLLARGDPDGLLVPGRPQSLSVWVYSTGFNATLTAQLRGADGRAVDASFGSLASNGWTSLQASLSGVGANEYPLRLRTLLVTPAGPNDSGDISLSDLRAGPAGGSSPVVEAFATPDGWWHEAVGRFGGQGSMAMGSRQHDGRPAVEIPTDVGGGALAMHPGASSAPLPAIISSQTAAHLGVGVGQTFPLHIEANDVDVKLVGTVDYFPTLYPGQDDFLLVPGESLTERLRLDDAYAYANESWLKVRGSAAAAANAVQQVSRGEASIVDRESLENAALTNPLRLSLDAALVIGLVAALTLVVVGFGVHFLAVARGRVSESAIMQANGLPWRVVDRGLFIEQLVVVAYSVIAGAVLGAVMAWSILPVLQTSTLPDELIPPTMVTLDARTLLIAAAALLAASWAVGQAGIRSASRFRLHDELRSLA